MTDLAFAADLPAAVQLLTPPRVILFDWHATLVDTRDAMYQAVNEMLPRLPELGLHALILPYALHRSAEDARLAEYVREHLRLPPRIVRERRISRTDIFEILFGLFQHCVNFCDVFIRTERFNFATDFFNFFLELFGVFFWFV